MDSAKNERVLCLSVALSAVCEKLEKFDRLLSKLKKEYYEISMGII
ncbi:hypothetical protein GU830_05730 [Mannheimia haemolytica]|nr:hypothetical protein [Mannheimia haemolytica]